MGPPSPPPRLPHGPAGAAGPARTGERAPRLEGPGSLRDGGSSRTPHLRLRSGSLCRPQSVCPAAPGEEQPSPALRHRVLPPFHNLFLPPIWEGASSRVALPKGPGVSSCHGITAGDGGPDGSPCAQENPFGPAHPSGAALPGARGRRSPAEPGGGEGGGPAACENCYFSSITRNLCKCPGQDTSRPAGWGHGDNTAMEKSKLHLLTSSQIQITALAWRGEESERSM